MRLRGYAVLCLCFVVFSVAVWGMPSPGQESGTVRGSVVAASDNAALPGATVITIDESKHAITDASGHFVLRHLPLGSSVIQISHVGYHIASREVLIQKAGDTVEVEFKLVVKPAALRDITVSPGRFSIMGTEPVAAQTLTRSQLQSLPQFSEDLYRAVQRLPGLSSNDFSARFAVRGGEQEEVLVTLDGLELYEPFHLKDIDGGVFSIIDASVLQKVDLMTGAYPANYGDRLSGVFGLTSRGVPAGLRRVTAGVSFSNVRFASEGTFAQGRGSWLVSARRGYIDLILKLAGESNQIKPTYYDAYGRLQYQLNGHHVVTASALGAWDNLHDYGEDEDVGDSIRSQYDNRYAWVTLNSQWRPGLTSTNMVSTGRVSHERWAQSYHSSLRAVDYNAFDNRSFDFVSFKTDWEYELDDYLLLFWGAENRQMWADYDFQNRYYWYRFEGDEHGYWWTLDHVDTTAATLAPEGSRAGSYVSVRIRPTGILTTELGGRYDHVSYTGDNVWSPRANVVLQLDPTTALRAGWGRFYQSQRIDQIDVGDRESQFGHAERADHYMVGYEHQFESGTSLRVEAYYKKYSDLRPQARNTFDPIALFPEAEDDRLLVFREHTTSRGVEFFLKRDLGGPFSWWGSYSYAKVEDSIREIKFFPENVTSYQNVVLPNPHDQRHTLYLDLIYRPNPAWQFNLALQYHSGLPFTDAHLASGISDEGYFIYWVQADKQLAARFDDYKRVDLRVSRHFDAWGGRLTTYVELVNIMNTHNTRGYQYDIEWNGRYYYLDREVENWLGRLPSLGCYYEVTF